MCVRPVGDALNSSMTFGVKSDLQELCLAHWKEKNTL